MNENNVPSFFIAGLSLQKDDWIISKSKNYYATTFNKKQLLKNQDRVDFYSGKLKSYMRGSQQCISLVYDNTKEFDLKSLF